MTQETKATEPNGMRKILVVVMIAMAITTVGGFVLKGQCLGPWDGRQYSHLCYNDIQPLYGQRGVELGTFPYISNDPDGGDLGAGGIEYPVLTGIFMWAMGRFVNADINAYLIVTAVALAPFGFYVAYQLARLTRRRALMWAAAPAIVFYAFHNWDFLVVAATVAGIAFWRADRPLAAAVAFGVGGALKMYPLMFLAPLVLYVWQKEGWRTGYKEALKVAIEGVATWLLINLPFMIINFDGWWATYEFHRLRPPNYDSIWNIKFILADIATLNNVSFALTGASLIVVLLLGLWRSKRDGVFPFIQVAGALLAAFLLFNKVHSPQYTLWILPFFALINVSAVWWVAYTAVDIIVYVGVFRFFWAAQYLEANPQPAYQAMSFGVQARAVLLAVLIFVFLFSSEAGREEEEPAEELVSHPPPTVTPVGEQAPA